MTSASTAGRRQLDGYIAVFEEARARLHAVADPLSDDAFLAKPSAKGWSVGECIVHLNVMAAGYLPALQEAVADPAAPRADGPFRYGPVSRLFIAAQRPTGPRIPTAPAMAPPAPDGLRATVDRDRAIRGLDASTDGYVAVCHAADGMDLRRVRLRSPFLPIWFSLGAYLDALGQHALRHTVQAERVAAGLGRAGA